MSTKTESEEAQPEQITISRREIDDWLQRVHEAIQPTVNYTGDHRAMLDEAYNKRGATLYFLSNRINSIITWDER